MKAVRKAQPPPALLIVAAPKPTRPRVRIGARYTPGTLVRLPGPGVYYEVAPVDQGSSADALQQALLSAYTPKQLTISRGVVEATWMRLFEMIDRMVFAFLGMFGVAR